MCLPCLRCSRASRAKACQLLLQGLDVSLHLTHEPVIWDQRAGNMSISTYAESALTIFCPLEALHLEKFELESTSYHCFIFTRPETAPFRMRQFLSHEKNNSHCKAAVVYKVQSINFSIISQLLPILYFLGLHTPFDTIT